MPKLLVNFVCPSTSPSKTLQRCRAERAFAGERGGCAGGRVPAGASPGRPSSDRSSSTVRFRQSREMEAAPLSRGAGSVVDAGEATAVRAGDEAVAVVGQRKMQRAISHLTSVDRYRSDAVWHNKVDEIDWKDSLRWHQVMRGERLTKRIRPLSTRLLS